MTHWKNEMKARAKRATFLILKKAALLALERGLDRLPGALKLANLIYRSFKSSHLSYPVEVRGFKMYIDQGGLGCGTLLWLKGAHEEFETEVFERLVPVGGTLLDIGAAVGYYTLIGAKLVGSEGKVYAFEPEPTNYSLLTRNVDLNGLMNVVLVPKGVSNKTGLCRLYVSDTNRSGHSIVDKRGRASIIMIETITLDEFFGTSKVNVIKMDIEGGETLAILGAEKLIRSNGSLAILTEFIPKVLRQSGVGSEEFLNKLVQLGFKLYHINSRARRLELIGADLDIRLHHGVTNLLCLKNKELPLGISTGVIS